MPVKGQEEIITIAQLDAYKECLRREGFSEANIECLTKDYRVIHVFHEGVEVYL